MKKQFFRVKQLADQTFLRAEKSKILSDEELQVADHKVEYLRLALSAINKKLPPSGPNIDIEKRAKKCLEYQLGSIFLEQCLKKRESEIFDGYGECRLFQDILREAGCIEQQLAKEYAEHEVKVEDLISIPIQKLIDSEFPTITKHKRNLSKYSLDKDSTNSRYQSTKKEALKDELEEADVKVEQCRDTLAIEMFNLLAKENEFASYILQLLKLQRGYHESALNNLQTIIPQLERKIGYSSVKRVFGIPLEEHLKVTGKHIAYPLEICITALTEIGMYEEGLFRLTGSMSKVKRFKASIDSGCFCEIIPEYRDVHVIASILKLYLRELPEPLLTYTLYNEWMQVVNQPENQRVDNVKGILKKLPRENMENLTYLIQFLAKLSQNTVNKMSSSNIAIVMSPNLLWGQNDDANMSMGNCATTNVLVELFIREVDELFKENVSQYVTPLHLFVEEERSFRTDADHHNDLSASSESIQMTDSPRPNTRKKKAAPVPPNSHSKTDHDLPIERSSLSSSYPSGSSTLSRKPKENKVKTSTTGTNTEGKTNLTRRSSLNQEDKRNLKISQETRDTLLVNNVEHKYVTSPTASTHVSKAEPVLAPTPQIASEDKRYKTTAIHTVHNPIDKPVAAPRSFVDNGTIGRTSTIRGPGSEEVQLRKPEVVKPEIPARPASLQQKRSSFELATADPTLQKTQCSVYSVANKQQPSFVNIHNTREKYQLGHDNQIAEKEKFLGHQPSERVTPLPRTRLSEISSEKPPVGPTERNTVISVSEKFLNNEKQFRISEKPHIVSEKPFIVPEKRQFSSEKLQLGTEKPQTIFEQNNVDASDSCETETVRDISEEKNDANADIIERHSILERPITLPVKPGIPPKCLSRSMIDKSKTKSNEKLNSAKSNEKLHEISNGGNQRKSSHSRTRSDGNLIDLNKDAPLSPLTPSSPRSLNKPTQPPPPPPIQVKKKDGDSTDL